MENNVKLVNYMLIVMLFCITIPLIEAAGVQIGQAKNGVIISTPSLQSCFICNGTGNTTYINNTYINNTYINQTFILNETIWANDTDNIFPRTGFNQNIILTNRSIYLSGSPTGNIIQEIHIDEEGDYGLYVSGNTADGIVVAGIVNLSSVFNGYGYSAEAYYIAQATGRSYWGYLSRPLIGGPANANELIGYLGAQRTFSSIIPYAGTLENFTSFESKGTWTSGTATNAVGFKASDVTYGGGTIVNNYGLKVEQLTAGTNNYAIWTEDNLARLGGNLNVSKNVTATYYRGNGTFLTGVCHSASDPGCSSTGNPFDQVLNTTSNVTFNNVTATRFTGNGSGLTNVVLTTTNQIAIAGNKNWTNVATFSSPSSSGGLIANTKAIFNRNVDFGTFITVSVNNISFYSRPTFYDLTIWEDNVGMQFGTSNPVSIVNDIGAGYLAFDHTGVDPMGMQFLGFDYVDYGSAQIYSLGGAFFDILYPYNGDQTGSIGDPNNKWKNASIMDIFSRKIDAENITSSRSLFVNQTIQTSAVPTIAAGAGAGTAPTVSISGTGAGGQVNVTTGTLPSLSSIVALATYTQSYPTNSYVVFSPANANAAGLSGVTMVYADSNRTGFSIISGSTALAGATNYLWNYQVVGN